jgi:hypothetical protein
MVCNSELAERNGSLRSEKSGRKCIRRKARSIPERFSRTAVKPNGILGTRRQGLSAGLHLQDTSSEEGRYPSR